MRARARPAPSWLSRRRRPHERSLGERPLDERPLDERPLDERPLDERPLDERPWWRPLAGPASWPAHGLSPVRPFRPRRQAWPVRRQAYRGLPRSVATRPPTRRFGSRQRVPNRSALVERPPDAIAVHPRARSSCLLRLLCIRLQHIMGQYLVRYVPFGMASEV
ncbi:hypothetical protein P171DRAFT_209939 [Karstenula rhodostoma CBS 690.94]|uniref:Uncharacterized protein n=1 Tax=Karstenula rhodostoma CBS 690.94 TaxID=1392251 RepID=A0A9P4UGJ1_9PLEO|nr:hypothetical protein P171DRAFT_209939 [Karstenula rhodostoma CBS 690.94]